MIPNISAQYKCIFVHIPKTGGTSIEHALGMYQLNGERGQQDHRTIAKIKEDLSEEQFESYFKFSFVRNPWARVVSWYRNVMRDPLHQKELEIENPHLTFRDFLHHYHHSWALREQLYWLKDEKGQIPLNFIGRFEQLQQDFAIVCQKLNMQNKILPNLLASEPCEYVSFYDEKLRDAVASRYAEDIAYFNYKFGE